MSEPESDAHRQNMVRLNLLSLCASAVLADQPTVTITVDGKRPPGLPRGELLSVGANGARNYAVDPIKLLAWLRKNTTRAGLPP